MIVAAIDSAELSGLAVVARDGDVEQLLWRAATKIRTAGDVTAVVHSLAGWLPDVVAIEEPFFIPRAPAAGVALNRLLGRWLQAFERDARVGVVTIPASMWQPRMLPSFTPRMRSAERKAAAVRLVRDRFDVEATEDEADAIALALYVARNVSTRRVP
jgi:Holliday junction resolvasome RuvABC endonuclease subunit